MVIRQERKRKSYLGNRTRGAGDTKNRRGRGSKGGVGNTGKWKHKANLHLGKNSKFNSIGTKKRQVSDRVENGISLYDLNNYIEIQILEKRFKKDGIVLDFKENKDLSKYDKVLGNGNFKYKAEFKNVKLTQSAKDKISALGGRFE